MSLKLVEDFPQAGVLNLGGGYKVYGRACCTVCISVLKCCTVYDSVWKCVCVCVLEYVYICMYVCMCMCGCTRSMYVRDRVYYLMLHHVLSLCVESLCVARVVYVRWLDNVYQLYGWMYVCTYFVIHSCCHPCLILTSSCVYFLSFLGRPYELRILYWPFEGRPSSRWRVPGGNAVEVDVEVIKESWTVDLIDFIVFNLRLLHFSASHSNCFTFVLFGFSVIRLRFFL